MKLISDLSAFVVPAMVIGTLLVALWRKVDVFGTFVEGAEDGLKLSVTVLPYLIGIYVAIGVFKDSGALDYVVQVLQPLLRPAGIPGPVLPLILIRPLSGSASLGIVAHLLKTYGPESYIGRLTSVIQGSSETTLYVVTLYLGSIGLRRSGYALPVCLIGDLVGFIAAVVVTHWLYGAPVHL